MALTDNPFIGLPMATLQDLQTKGVQAYSDILTVGRSWAFPGQSVTLADLEQLKIMMGQVRIAISYTQGNIMQTAQAVVDTQSQFDP